MTSNNTTTDKMIRIIWASSHGVVLATIFLLCASIAYITGTSMAQYIRIVAENLHQYARSIRIEVARKIRASSTALASLALEEMSSNFPFIKKKRFDTFTCFQRLPPEIRIKIWKMATMNHPAVHVYDWGDWWDGGWIRGTTYKSIYLVNKESYMEAAKLNPYLSFHLYLDPGWPKKVRFNWEIDTVIFMPDHFTHVGSPVLINLLDQGPTNRETLKTIRSIGFREYGDMERDGEIVIAYEPLANLKKVTFYPRVERWSIAVPEYEMVKYPGGEDGTVPRCSEYIERHLKIMKKRVGAGMWEGKIPDVFIARRRGDQHSGGHRLLKWPNWWRK